MRQNDTLHLRLDSQTKRDLASIANRQRRTYSDVARCALAAWLAQQREAQKTNGGKNG